MIGRPHPELGWHPANTENRRPVAGDIVGIAHAAWRVVSVDPVHDANLTDEERDLMLSYREPWREERRPYRLVLTLAYGDYPKAWRAANSAGHIPVRAGGRRGHPEVYESGRVPLCSCHSHPWPCRDYEEQVIAERAAERAEREMALLPGCCPACQEPVTSRQRSITFPGPYLRNPLGPPDPTFHLRWKCYGAAGAYEEQWVAADADQRPRSLLTLRCAGRLTVHGDGTAECHGRTDGSDCPSLYATHHRGVTPCGYLYGGCPICPAGLEARSTSARDPGPADPRDIHGEGPHLAPRRCRSR